VTHATADIIGVWRAIGAPCSELNDVSQMLAHEQVQASGIVAPLPVGAAADDRVVALPLKLNGERSRNRKPPPALGAHTDDVLAGLGRSPADIAQLRAAKTVA
jgi:crotonobetainyl-CoA:carnitine CoA-transferase CaiB-like acyl-CoA transferase